METRPLLENADIFPKWHINNEIFHRRIRDSFEKKNGSFTALRHLKKTAAFLGRELFSFNQKMEKAKGERTGG